MVQPYDPTPNQPLGVFFELELGTLSQIYAPPEIPIEARITIEQGGTISLQFTVLDLSGILIESALAEANKKFGYPSGSFRWGWTNAKQSDRYNFMVENYLPVFSGNAFITTLMGFAPTITPYMSCNDNSGTLKEILDKFCQDHELELVIDPLFGPEYMQDVGYNDAKSSDTKEMRHCKWEDETDFAYLERVLKFARDQNGGGAYSYHLGQNSDGKPTLFVTRPQDGTANYVYEIQHKETVHTTWAPDMDYTAALWGQNDIQANGYQRITGDEQKAVMQVQNTADYQTTFGKNYFLEVKAAPDSGKAQELVYYNTETMPEEVTGSKIRSRPVASVSPGAGLNPVLNDHLMAGLCCLSGTLTVLGDPSLSVMTNGKPTLVEVRCYLPINYSNPNAPQELHISSGIYMVEKVEHIISGGSYLSVLSLIRPTF